MEWLRLRDLQRSSGPSAPAEAWPPTAECPGPCPDRS